MARPGHKAPRELARARRGRRGARGAPPALPRDACTARCSPPAARDAQLTQTRPGGSIPDNEFLEVD